MTQRAKNERIIQLGIEESRSDQPVAVWRCKSGGKTVFTGSKVSSMSVPDPNTSMGRVIRAHELLHAKHEPTRPVGKYPHDIQDAISDAYIQAHHWPRADLGFLDDDLKEVMHQDLRDLLEVWPTVQEPEDWPGFNRCIHIALRIVAIQQYLRRKYPCDSKKVRYGQDIILRSSGEDEVYRARLRRYWPALERLCYHIMLEGPEAKKQWRKYRKRITDEYINLLKNPPPCELSGVKPVRANPWEEHEHGGREGEAGEKIMEIVHLPKTMPTDPASSRPIPARSGQRLNMGRVSSCLATGRMHGMFRKRRLVPQMGSTLIDFSGSMSFSREQAHEICRINPGGTLAYYEGRGCSKPYWGRLTIYAENGLRSDAMPEREWGANDVDYWALMWLLQQPKPRYFITDEGFCGGPGVEGVPQERAAHELLRQAMNANEVEVIYTVNEALNRFRKL